MVEHFNPSTMFVTMVVGCSLLGQCLGKLTAAGYKDWRCSAELTCGSQTNTFTQAYFSANLDNNIAHSYMVESPDYTFQCCGFITHWELIAAGTGTIQLHVWRRLSTNEYLMVGENYCTITSAGPVTCNISEYDRILVHKGDFIGWHNQGNETLKYVTEHFSGTAYQNMFHRQNIGDKYPGDVFDWSQVEAYNDRDYGIRAIYSPSNAPTVSASNLIVPDYLSSGTTIGRFTFNDQDFMDNRSLVVTYLRTSPSLYTPDKTSGYITAVNSYRPQDDQLDYYVYDLCYHDAEASHTITVQKTPLTIDTLDALLMLSESQTEQELLHTITCTELTDPWYCFSNWDTSWPFMLKAETITSYGVYVTEYPELDYGTKSQYLLEVQCVENNVDNKPTATGTLTIELVENLPPSLTNLDGYAVVDAEVARKGDTVFNATATDPENDILTYAMACDPNTPRSFEITKNGNVQLMSFVLLSSVFQFDCTVTVTDTYANTDSRKLHISLSNVDAAATISNMPPNALQIQENMPLGTILYTFTYQDVDPDVKTWSVAYDHPDASRYFHMDPSSGTLTLAFSEIDYESVRVSKTFTLTIMVGDVKSTASNTLDVIIKNENEAPWFHEDYYTLEVDEGPHDYIVSNGNIFTASFTDEDKTDASNTYESHTYRLDCDSETNTHRFYMHPNTAVIKYRGDYDLDVSGTPLDVECTVTVRDYYGLFDTVKLNIHVNYVNEFTPEFTHSTYNFYLASNALVGKFVGTVRAVDLDSGNENHTDIIYSFNYASSGLTNTFAVNHDGSVYLMSSLTAMAGSYGPFYIEATNPGGATTGSTTVTLHIPGTTTVTTTTTDRNTGFYESPWTYYWLLATLAGVVMLVIVISLVCFRICRLTRIGPYCYNCCMRGWCCRPPPSKPRGFGDRGYDLASFGHKHLYADEDTNYDGWEPIITTSNTRRNKKSKVGLSGAPASPLPVDSHGRYGTPLEGYRGDEELTLRREPVYEMFKVPDNKQYLDPQTSTRNVGRWKINEGKPLITGRFGRP